MSLKRQYTFVHSTTEGKSSFLEGKFLDAKSMEEAIEVEQMQIEV